MTKKNEDNKFKQFLNDYEENFGEYFCGGRFCYGVYG